MTFSSITITNCLRTLYAIAKPEKRHPNVVYLQSFSRYVPPGKDQDHKRPQFHYAAASCEYVTVEPTWKCRMSKLLSLEYIMVMDKRFKNYKTRNNRFSFGQISITKKISKFLNEGPETKSFGPVSLEQKSMTTNASLISS